MSVSAFLPLLSGWPVIATGQLAVSPPRPFQNAVTLPVDQEAQKRLLTIDDRWAVGRWEDALNDLIALSQSSGKSLVEVERNEAAGLARYQQVATAGEHWLQTLPARGLARYRAQMDLVARPLWDQWKATRDPGLLRRITREMYFSSLAPQALWELGQQMFFEGQFELAHRYWGQLLPPGLDFPGVGSRRVPESLWAPADVAARLVLCDLFRDQTAGRSALQRFQELFPDAQGQLAGKEGLWSDLLSQVVSHQTTEIPAHFEPGITTFGGHASRNGRSPRTIDIGSELWSAPLREVVLPRSSYFSLLPVSPPLAYYPAIADDIVYLNDGDRIWAWSLYSGKPAWSQLPGGTAVIYPVVDHEPPLPPRRTVSGSPLWTVTVANGRLYACLGAPVTNATPLELRDQSTDLVCLDVAEGQGRLLWKISSEELSSRLATTDDDAPPWCWEGTPLVLGTRLYGVLSRRRPQLEWSIVCLDSESSQLLWHRPIGITRPTPPANENLASHLLLTAAGGRLFLATHWGAIVALSPLSGELEWAATYRSEPPDESHPERVPRSAYPPALASGDRLYVAPADSPQIYCFSISSGELIWNRQLPDQVTQLIGVHDNRLVLSGQRLWGLNAANGNVAWKVEPANEQRRGYGRGWIAGSVVYWPAHDGVSVVGITQGEVLREQPFLTPSQHRTGGHLIAIDGVLLVAGANRLTVYGEYARLRDTHENWLSQWPDDHRLKYRLGELAWSQGDLPAAVGRWKSALPTETHSQPAQKSYSPDERVNVWQAQAAARLMTTCVQGNFESIARLQDRYRRAGDFAITPQLQRALLQAELAMPADADWRIDTLRRWTDFRERIDVRLAGWNHHGLTSWQIGQELSKIQPHSQRHSLTMGPLPVAVPRLTELVAHQNQERETLAIEGFNRAENEQPVGLWRLRWRRTRNPRTRVLTTTDRVADRTLLVADIGGVSALETQSGHERWIVPVAQSPEWIGVSDGRRILVTADEVLSVNALTGQVDWRRHSPVPPHHRHPNERSSAVHPRPRWGVIGEAILFIDPQRVVGSLDLATGELRWMENLSSSPWSFHCAVHRGKILAQEQKTGRPVMMDAHTGQRNPLVVAAQRPWTVDPKFSWTGDEFVVVDDQLRTTCFDTEWRIRWKYSGTMSNAHLPPYPLAVTNRWYLLIDGMRLADVGRQGRPRKQLSLTMRPQSLASRTVLFDDTRERLYVADAHQLIAVDLNAGTRLWSLPLPAVAERAELLPLGANQLVYVAGIREPAHPAEVECQIIDRQSGRLRQRLRMSGRLASGEPAGSELSESCLGSSKGDGFVVILKEELRGYRLQSLQNVGLD